MCDVSYSFDCCVKGAVFDDILDKGEGESGAWSDSLDWRGSEDQICFGFIADGGAHVVAGLDGEEESAVTDMARCSGNENDWDFGEGHSSCCVGFAVEDRRRRFWETGLQKLGNRQG